MRCHHAGNATALPGHFEGWFNLALAYGGMGDRDRAESLYEKMLDNDPKSMEALRGLAALAIQASDFDTALEYHVRLIDLGERSSEVLYNTGLMYEKAGQLDKAVRLYRDALAQQPDMPEALLNLGRILESNGKSDEARACWRKGTSGRRWIDAETARAGHARPLRRVAACLARARQLSSGPGKTAIKAIVGARHASPRAGASDQRLDDGHGVRRQLHCPALELPFASFRHDAAGPIHIVVGIRRITGEQPHLDRRIARQCA